MTKILSVVNDIVWGVPSLILILGVGLYLSWKLGLVQLRLLPQAMGNFFRSLLPENRDASSLKALCTALGATVGTGNLVGVAGAICLGGPGAIFWMWLSGLLGMATKYAEATLAVAYRVDSQGETLGGPMYMITRGMGQRFRFLAKGYCLLGILASFGVGNASQINAAVTGVKKAAAAFGGSDMPWIGPLMGAVLAVALGMLLFGGAGRIADAAQSLVPLAAGGYILMCLAVLIRFWDRIPEAMCAIVLGALDPKAVTGGMLGSAFQALRIGCSRGVFTNEAGMGTAAIAHGGAKVVHPVQQGLMGIVEVFLDTEVICTLTALVILISGVPIPYGTDAGALLSVDAFGAFYGKGASVLLALMLVAFAVATVLGWSLYGGRCTQFLFGKGSWKPFAAAQTAVIFLSAFLDTGTVWQFSETLNGLMVIPNLIALAALSGELCRLTKEYMKIRQTDAGGGTYADFHQCKPL